MTSLEILVLTKYGIDHTATKLRIHSLPSCRGPVDSTRSSRLSEYLLRETSAKRGI